MNKDPFDDFWNFHLPEIGRVNLSLQKATKRERKLLLIYIHTTYLGSNLVEFLLGFYSFTKLQKITDGLDIPLHMYIYILFMQKNPLLV